MDDSLAFRTAKQHVRIFTDESNLMEQHRQAMDCWNCEDFLKLGIDAYWWLARADMGLETIDHETARALDEALDAEFRAWLGPCEMAKRWIQEQLDRGHCPENLKEFMDCCEKAQEIVQRRDWERLGREARQSSFSQEAW